MQALAFAIGDIPIGNVMSMGGSISFKEWESKVVDAVKPRLRASAASVRKDIVAYCYA